MTYPVCSSGSTTLLQNAGSDTTGTAALHDEVVQSVQAAAGTMSTQISFPLSVGGPPLTSTVTHTSSKLAAAFSLPTMPTSCIPSTGTPASIVSPLFQNRSSACSEGDARYSTPAALHPLRSPSSSVSHARRALSPTGGSGKRPGLRPSPIARAGLALPIAQARTAPGSAYRQCRKYRVVIETALFSLLFLVFILVSLCQTIYESLNSSPLPVQGDSTEDQRLREVRSSRWLILGLAV